MAINVNQLTVGDKVTVREGDSNYYKVVSFRIPNNDANITGIDPNTDEVTNQRRLCEYLYWWGGQPAKRPTDANIVFPAAPNTIVDAPKPYLLGLYNRGILCTTFPTLTPVQCASLTVLVLAP